MAVSRRLLQLLKRASWALPLVLAVAFAASVGVWLRLSDMRDLEEERLTLIADALSLEARISDWLNAAGERRRPGPAEPSRGR